MDDNEEEQQENSAIPGRRGFRPGISGNSRGAPKKEDRKGYDPVLKKQSKLRATEKKLMKLTPQAIENIEKSVKGESVDKEVLTTSKWVITTAAAISKQAMMEELEINGIKDKLAQKEIEDSQAEDDDESGNAVFSMDLPTASTILN